MKNMEVDYNMCTYVKRTSCECMIPSTKLTFTSLT